MLFICQHLYLYLLDYIYMMDNRWQVLWKRHQSTLWITWKFMWHFRPSSINVRDIIAGSLGLVSHFTWFCRMGYASNYKTLKELQKKIFQHCLVNICIRWCTDLVQELQTMFKWKHDLFCGWVAGCSWVPLFYDLLIKIRVWITLLWPPICAMASQITSLAIVYSTVYSGADQ